MTLNIRILIVDNVLHQRENIKNILAREIRMQVVGECQGGEEVLKGLRMYQPDIILMNYDMPKVNTKALVRQIMNINPEQMVILMFSQQSQDYIKEAIDAGAKEYIIKPFSPNVLISTIENAYSTHKSWAAMMEEEASTKGKKPAIDSKVISIFSNKGGVGKTTLTINLAVTLAKQKKAKVVILDLDLQAGDVSIMMNLYPKRTIVDLSKDIYNLDDDIMDEYLVTHPSGIKVLPAPISPELSEYVTGGNVERIIKHLTENYDYIIIDTSPSFVDTNLTALDMSDHILYVTTLDLPSIKNLKAGLQVMEKLHYKDEKIHVIVNRYQKNHGISIHDIQKTTGKKIINSLSEDFETVFQSINAGEPFVLKSPKKNISQGVLAISKYIANR